jgi:tetratricopeptide (TPR) repeat protein
MTIKKMAQAAVLAALLGGPVAALAEPATADAVHAPTAFDELIGSAKAAMTSDPAAALVRSGEALTAARKGPAAADRAIHIATAQWLQGEALLRLNKPAEAQAVIEQALAVVAARQPNTNLHGRLLMARAGALQEQGQTRPALEGFQAAYDLFRAADDRRGQALALQNIGSIHQDTGDYEQVLRVYAQAAAVYPDEPALLVSAHNNTGNALKELGRYVEAEAAFKAALRISKELESPVLEARILTNLASTQVLSGHLDKAQDNIATGLRIADRDAAAAEWRAFMWGVSAQSALKRGDLRKAASLLDRTFEGVDPRTSQMVYRDFHRTAYQVYARLGDGSQASLHRRALQRLDGQAHHLARN